MDNPSLMGFGTFKVDNSEKVGSIFSASQVRQCSSRQRRQRRRFCIFTRCIIFRNMRGVRQQSVDTEGIFQPSKVFAVFYPLPSETSPEGSLERILHGPPQSDYSPKFSQLAGILERRELYAESFTWRIHHILL